MAAGSSTTIERGSHSGANFSLKSRRDSIWKNGLSTSAIRLSARWAGDSLALVSNSRPQAAKFIDSRLNPRSPSASAELAMRNSVTPLMESGLRCIRSSE